MTAKWMLASSHAELDPARYLGERRDLPPPGSPGDWCDVVVADERGELRWRVVVVDVAAADVDARDLADRGR